MQRCAAPLTLVLFLSGIFLISPSHAGGGKKKKNPFAPEPERGNQYLSGVVVDPQGKPVAGATVIAFLPDGTPVSPRAKDFDFAKRKSPREQTDDKGRFSLHDLPDKPIKLMIYPGKPWDRTAYPAHVRTTLNQSDIRVLLDPTLEQDIEDLDAPKGAKDPEKR
jgi:hypothetical protein